MAKILVVAEKPSVARDIAKVLNCSRKANGYIEGDKYIITWALGHLAGLKDPGEYKEEWKAWNLDQLPIIPEKFDIKVLEATKDHFKVIKSLMSRNDIEYIINAGDAGREGLLIQNWIYRLCNNKKPIKVLWISSYTDEAIKKGFNDLKDNKDFLLLQEAAESRAIIDWTIGMTYTRAYSIKKGNEKAVLSIGRCQTPILNLIVQRDIEIEKFKPSPYYQIEVILNKNGHDFKGILTYDKKKAAAIEDLHEAELLLNDIGSEAEVVEVKEEKKNVSAPLLYDITTLQQVMDNKYGYSAAKTLELAQSLYEKHKILSYPRTSSRYLSSDIYHEINKHLNCINFGKFKDNISLISYQKDIKSYFNDQKVTDHHALIPTINNDIETIYPRLTEDEKRVFDEVALSLVAIFYPGYEYMTSTVITQSGKQLFLTRGKVEINKGWKVIKQDFEEENKEGTVSLIPELNQGEHIPIEDKNMLSKMTKSKPHYTEATILGEMIKFNIGTQATRHVIIDKLIKRNYCEKEKKKLISTNLGRDLISAIDIQEIKSIELTSDIENKLLLIENGQASRKSVLGEIFDTLTKNVELIKKSEGTISSANFKETQETLVCPICKQGHVFHNSKAYSCSNWKNGCKFTIWNQIAGKKITDSMVKLLVTKGKTNLIKGFKSTKGKVFDAYLVFKDNKIDFEFKK